MFTHVRRRDFERRGAGKVVGAVVLFQVDEIIAAVVAGEVGWGDYGCESRSTAQSSYSIKKKRGEHPSLDQVARVVARLDGDGAALGQALNHAEVGLVCVRDDAGL